MTDKPTDTRAAALVSTPKPVRATHKKMILEYIARRGLSGATCEEIEEKFALRHQSASARLAEMSRDDRTIKDGGERRKTALGRGAIVWIVTDKGLQQTDAKPATTETATSRPEIKGTREREWSRPNFGRMQP